MPMPSKLIPYTQNRICLNLPEISSDKWSDFRREYEQGKTLKQIALEYHCDPRTVRKCLFLNQGSNDIGKQHCTKKLTAYLPMIDELYRKYTGIDGSEASSPDTDGKAVSGRARGSAVPDPRRTENPLLVQPGRTVRGSRRARHRSPEKGLILNLQRMNRILGIPMRSSAFSSPAKSGPSVPFP